MKKSAKSPVSGQPLTHKMTVTAMLSAVSAVLMFIEISIPIMPSFIKLDISELPALLASFSLGPVYGVIVCLVKNLVSLTHTTSSGVGELCNFLLGAVFVFTTGMVYSKMKNRKGALIGSLIGAFVMAAMSLPINYFVTYPFYLKLYYMTAEQMVGLYQVILPSVKSLLDCLLIFNTPFTFVKGLIDVGLTFLIYKRLSPILHK